MTELVRERVKAILDPKIFGTLSDEDLATIKSCDIGELVTIFGSCTIADEGFLGIANRPRCSENCAEAIDALMVNRIELVRHHVIEELRHRIPKDNCELKERSRCLAQWAIACENWAEAINVLADLVPKAEVAQVRP